MNGIDFSYLKKLVWDWISTQTEAPVIWSDQAAPGRREEIRQVKIRMECLNPLSRYLTPLLRLKPKRDDSVLDGGWRYQPDAFTTPNDLHSGLIRFGRRGGSISSCRKTYRCFPVIGFPITGGDLLCGSRFGYSD